MSAVNYAVYQGSIIEGEDYTGDFGAVGVLQGSFTAVFQFNLDAGHHQEGTFSETSTGGPGTGFGSPIVSAALYIGGHEVIFPGPAGSYGGFEVANLIGAPGGDYADVVTYSQTLLPTISASLLLHAYTNDAPTRVMPYVGLQANYFDPPSIANWSETVAGQEVDHFSATLEVHRVTLTDNAAPYVPEPATWALMVGGFGLVGAALRLRRRAVAG